MSNFKLLSSKNMEKDLIDQKVLKSIDYLNTFIDSHYDQFNMSMNELQPHKGYGQFENSDLVVQGMRNIVHTLSDEFANASIPETFSSPKEYVESIKRFITLLKKEKGLAEKTANLYLERNKSVPTPITGLWDMSNKTLNAFEHAYGPQENNSTTRTKQENLYGSLEQLLGRFDRVVQQIKNRRNEGGAARPTLKISDEYDVQDLLRGLLCIFFDDVREEEWTPSYAGGSKRMDFLLKNEQCVIEVKKTRVGLTDKKLGEELTIDIANYKHHNDCKVLFCFIYDPDKMIRNPDGLIVDLQKQKTKECDVRVIINR